MDEKLHILLQHLYGEREDRAELHRLLEDPALRAEYEVLNAVKEDLDRRERSRPDAAVIDRIVAAAHPQDPASLQRRPDRAARPGRTARRYRLAGVLGTVLALIFVVGLGWRQLRTAPQEVAADRQAVLKEEVPSSDADEAAALAEDALEAVGAGERLRAGAPQPAVPPEAEPGPVAASPSDSLPAWDEGDELLRVHRSIEVLEARSPELTWDDAPVMSLDVLPPPSPSAPRGLNAASEKRNGNQ